MRFFRLLSYNNSLVVIPLSSSWWKLLMAMSPTQRNENAVAMFHNLCYVRPGRIKKPHTYIAAQKCLVLRAHPPLFLKFHTVECQTNGGIPNKQGVQKFLKINKQGDADNFRGSKNSRKLHVFTKISILEM